MSALSVLGLTLSGYLSWHYLVGGTLIGCSGAGPSGCEHVLNSRWSVIGGVLPVSGLAAGAYLAMLVCSFSVGTATAPSVRRLAWSALLILTGAAAGSAVWFTVLQIWVIKAFCPYCLATHLTGLLLAGLVIRQAPRQIDDSVPDVSRPIFSAWSAAGRMLAGLALAGTMAVVQISITPTSAYRSGQSPVDLATLDPRAVPLVGSPDASHVVTLLFDYNCPHCQRLHLMLDGAIRRYGGKLAFALCPAPLNSRCNPYVPGNADEFKDSCELVKIALAVWMANRETFPVFDRWMFSYDSGDRWRPRSLDAARAKAVELVGQAKFDAALANPWIDEYMKTSIRIYGGTMQGGAGGVPKLVFGTRWVSPEPDNTDDLVSILQNRLAVPNP